MQRLKRFLTFIITISIVVSALGTMSFADTAADGHTIVCSISPWQFKDANFMSYILQNLDLDHDGFIDDYEVSQTTKISVNSKEISLKESRYIRFISQLFLYYFNPLNIHKHTL